MMVALIDARIFAVEQHTHMHAYTFTKNIHTCMHICQVGRSSNVQFLVEVQFVNSFSSIVLYQFCCAILASCTWRCHSKAKQSKAKAINPIKEPHEAIWAFTLNQTVQRCFHINACVHSA